MLRTHTCLSLLCAAALLPAQRTPQGTVGSGGGQTAPAIATSAALTCIAWADGVRVLLNRSLDGGGTWLPSPVFVDNGSHCAASDVSVAIDGMHVGVVWGSGDGCIPFGGPTIQRVCCNRSDDGGVTWQPTDTVISASPAFVYRPRLAADGSHLFVVWEDERNGATDIYCNRSLDGGVTWLPAATRVETGPAGSWSDGQCIAASGTNVYVTWQDGRNGNSNVYFNRSTDGGLTWLASDVRLDVGTVPGAVWVANAQLAADGATVCVVWVDPRGWAVSGSVSDADVWCNRSMDGGLTWLPSAVHVGPGNTQGTIQAMEPCVAMHGTTVNVCWRDARYGGWNVFARRSIDGGATWLSNETRLSAPPATGTAFALLPQVVATADVVTAVFGKDLPFNVYCNRSVDDGVTWLADDVRLDVAPGASATHSTRIVVAARDAEVHAAWVEGSAVATNLPFGFVRYGAGNAGTGGFVPTLAGSGSPTLGGALSLELGTALGGSLGVFVVGGGPASRISVPLFGGTLLVQPFTTLGLALGGTGAGNGQASLPIGVPATPSLVGANLNFQVLVLDPAAAAGLVFSNAVEVWIG